jgi:tetratricopeptide (TPR) repeat protein
VIRLLNAGIAGAGMVLFTLVFLLPTSASVARPLSKLDRLVFEPAALASDRVNDGLRGDRIPSANSTAPADLAVGANERLPIEESAQSIDTREIEESPNSPAQYDELMRLGRLYQQRGEHMRALAAFARARRVSRMDSGFYSVEQIGALDQSLGSLVATGQLQTADRGYEELVRLTKKHYGADALEVVPALAKLGDFKLDAFHRAVRSGLSPEAGLGGRDAVEQQGSPTETESRRDAFELLKAAQSAYLEAIGLLVDHEQFHDARLRQLELSLVETVFLQAYRDNIVENPLDYMPSRRLGIDSIVRKPGASDYSRRFGYGEDAYIRMLSYLKRDSGATIEEFGRTLVGLGDWYMLFGHRSAAIAKYQQALAILEAGGASDKTVANLLRPDVPVRLPTFVAAPHAPGTFSADAADALTHDGYIDVHFSLNKYGRAQDIEVLGGAAAPSNAVRGRLVWMLRDAQFRPVFDGDAPAANAPIDVRYYVAY